MPRYLPLRSLCRVVLAAVAALMLAGCYTTDAPLLEFGDRVPVVDPFICEESETEGVTALEELSTGVMFREYAYKDSEGSRYVFLQVEDGLYLVQVESHEGQIFYIYFDFRPGGSFNILMPDFAGKATALNELAEKFGVTTDSGSNIGMLKLSAENPDDILAFLMDHDIRLMESIGTCHPAG